jgi:hypothetical protein
MSASSCEFKSHLRHHTHSASGPARRLDVLATLHAGPVVDGHHVPRALEPGSLHFGVRHPGVLRRVGRFGLSHQEAGCDQEDGGQSQPVAVERVVGSRRKREQATRDAQPDRHACGPLRAAEWR